jgi:hypothetical protein
MSVCVCGKKECQRGFFMIIAVSKGSMPATDRQRASIASLEGSNRVYDETLTVTQASRLIDELASRRDAKRNFDQAPPATQKEPTVLPLFTPSCADDVSILMLLHIQKSPAPVRADELYNVVQSAYRFSDNNPVSRVVNRILDSAILCAEHSLHSEYIKARDTGILTRSQFGPHPRWFRSNNSLIIIRPKQGGVRVLSETDKTNLKNEILDAVDARVTESVATAIGAALPVMMETMMTAMMSALASKK